jgi:hypothetical protein
MCYLLVILCTYFFGVYMLWMSAIDGCWIIVATLLSSVFFYGSRKYGGGVKPTTIQRKSSMLRVKLRRAQKLNGASQPMLHLASNVDYKKYFLLFMHWLQLLPLKKAAKWQPFFNWLSNQFYCLITFSVFTMSPICTRT